MNKQKVIVLVGPTAVGKTDLSIQIAKYFNLDVISGDSMQVYKDMDIGTGKIKPEEMEGITHHMLNIKSPNEEFSVREFQSRVESLFGTVKVPFIVGGTGLYIKSLLYGYDFNDEDAELKQSYVTHYEQYDNETLYNMLNNEDKKTVHKNNRKRLIRMLVKHDLHDDTEDNDKTLKYDALIIGLTTDREKLYARINTRVEKMMEAGLLEEVKALHEKYNLSKTARVAIGYREFESYFNEEKSIEAVTLAIQKNSRNYAKRQLTFFNNQLNVHWFDALNYNVSEVYALIENYLKT